MCCDRERHTALFTFWNFKCLTVRLYIQFRGKTNEEKCQESEGLLDRNQHASWGKRFIWPNIVSGSEH